MVIVVYLFLLVLGCIQLGLLSAESEDSLEKPGFGHNPISVDSRFFDLRRALNLLFPGSTPRMPGFNQGTSKRRPNGMGSLGSFQFQPTESQYQSGHPENERGLGSIQRPDPNFSSNQSTSFPVSGMERNLRRGYSNQGVQNGLGSEQNVKDNQPGQGGHFNQRAPNSRTFTNQQPYEHVPQGSAQTGRVVYVNKKPRNNDFQDKMPVNSRPGQQENQGFPSQAYQNNFRPGSDSKQRTDRDNGGSLDSIIAGNNPSGQSPSDQSSSDQITAILGKPVFVPTTTMPPGLIIFESGLKNAKAQTQCVQDCRTTSEYHPVCGSNNVTYFNPGRFQCARNCGLNVFVKQEGRCT